MKFRLSYASIGLHDELTRSHRARDILRGCISSPGPGVKWEAVGRTERVCFWGHREIDDVSSRINTMPAECSFTRCRERRTVAEIQGKVVHRSKRNPVSRFFGSKNDNDAIAA